MRTSVHISYWSVLITRREMRNSPVHPLSLACRADPEHDEVVIETEESLLRFTSFLTDICRCCWTLMEQQHDDDDDDERKQSTAGITTIIDDQWVSLTETIRKKKRKPTPHCSSCINDLNDIDLTASCTLRKGLFPNQLKVNSSFSPLSRHSNHV